MGSREGRMPRKAISIRTVGRLHSGEVEGHEQSKQDEGCRETGYIVVIASMSSSSFQDLAGTRTKAGIVQTLGLSPTFHLAIDASGDFHHPRCAFVPIHLMSFTGYANGT